MRVRECRVMSTWKCLHLYVRQRLGGSDTQPRLKAKVNGLTVTCF